MSLEEMFEKLESADDQQLGEIKLWLFKESIRLRDERFDLEMEKRDFLTERENTREEIRDNEDRIDSMEGEQAQVGSRIDNTTEEIAALMATIALQKEEIGQLKDDIRVQKKKMDSAEKKLKKQSGRMEERIQAIYEEGEVSYLEVLLTASSYSDMLAKSEYVSQLYAYDKGLLDKYRSSSEAAAQEKAELSARRILEKEAEDEERSFPLALEARRVTTEGYISRAFIIGCSAALADQQLYAMTDSQQVTVRVMEFLLKTDASDLQIAPKEAIRPALGTGSTSLGSVLLVALPLSVLFAALLILGPRRDR